MNDKILQRYTNRVADNGAEPSGPEEPDVTDDLGTFGWLRGTRERAVMLELRKKNGNILAVGYGWLEKAAFDPSEGITLFLCGQTIRITGRNLNAEIRPQVRLYHGITRHRVPWLQEADETSAMQAAKTATVVEKIEW